MSSKTYGALAGLYATRERKAEDRLLRCRRLLQEAEVRLDKATADHRRFREVVRRQEAALYREIMAKVARKEDFETLKERMHLLKMQLNDYLERMLECQRDRQEAEAALREAQAHYHAMLRKHAKLGELRDELTRAEGREALRREGLELEEVRPPRPDTPTGGPAAIT